MDQFVHQAENQRKLSNVNSLFFYNGTVVVTSPLRALPAVLHTHNSVASPPLQALQRLPAGPPLGVPLLAGRRGPASVRPQLPGAAGGRPGAELSEPQGPGAVPGGQRALPPAQPAAGPAAPAAAPLRQGGQMLAWRPDSLRSHRVWSRSVGKCLFPGWWTLV